MRIYPGNPALRLRSSSLALHLSLLGDSSPRLQIFEDPMRRISRRLRGSSSLTPSPLGPRALRQLQRLPRGDAREAKIRRLGAPGISRVVYLDAPPRESGEINKACEGREGGKGSFRSFR